MIDGNNYLTPEALVVELNEKNLLRSDIQSIRLLMCYSADGDEQSFAQGLANLTKTNVKGFKGQVLATNIEEKMAQWVKINPGRTDFQLDKIIVDKHPVMVVLIFVFFCFGLLRGC